MTIRAREEPVSSTAAARMACTGAVRPARKAGIITAARVMTVPVTRVITTIQGVRANPVPGRVMSNRPRTHFTTRLSRTPLARPTALAPSPSRKPSPSSDRRTWPGVPPIERTRASSRVRWPTTTVKVL